MKRILIFVFCLLPGWLFCQNNLELIFTGINQNDEWVPLSWVQLENQSQDWQEVLYYPDTMYHIGNVGIENASNDGNFRLFQNVPNPFDGTTYFMLQLKQDQVVFLSIVDINGRLITKYEGKLQQGQHLFQTMLLTPQTYILSAQTQSDFVHIKLANAGIGESNSIEYIGSKEFSSADENVKTSAFNMFNWGDVMKYVGHAILDGMEFESDSIVKQQTESDTIRLMFNLPLPVVSTLAASDVSSDGGRLNGNANGNGHSIMEKGFYYGTTEDLSTKEIASDVLDGDYYISLSNLQPGTTYYYRAYASTGIGANQGQVETFHTSALVPSILTDSVYYISSYTASASGTVLSDNGSSIIERGFCWSNVNMIPSVNDEYWVDDSASNGSFSAIITNLQANTTYYLRAFSVNDVGVAYGDVISFTTELIGLPCVTTSGPYSITQLSAVVSGTVISDGGSPVIERGFCWGTLQNPTLTNYHSTDGNGIGNFSHEILGLSMNTTYYVRAYSTNSIGTVYGNTIAFTTPAPGPCPQVPTVTDYDGNVYNTIIIGSQCWMKENLKTTHYEDGTFIDIGTGMSATIALRYYPNSTNNTVDEFGYLYNWKAAMGNANSSTSNPSGVQGACPAGWHLPSYEEYIQLSNYLGSQQEYKCGYASANTAKSIASKTGWTSNGENCSIGNNASVNNATGFTAMPVGIFNSGGCYGEGNYTKFWSATKKDNNNAYCFSLTASLPYVSVDYLLKTPGLSIRCVMDYASTVSNPSVITHSVTDVTETSAVLSGEVTADGGDSVIARGFCWSANFSNPTLSNMHSVNGSDTGSFSHTIGGLAPGTTYVVRAYATNHYGTSYGDNVCFVTTAITSPDTIETPTNERLCTQVDSVVDYDGNVYSTVQIGNQCWMKENLRTTHYSDGTYLPLGSSTDVSMAFRYLPTDDSSSVAADGYLYNWRAAMGSYALLDTIPSVVQGICPDGWHLPGEVEWEQLSSYLRHQQDCYCGTNNTYIAKSIASTTGWNSSSESCTIGKMQEENNTSGFSALPIGYFGNLGHYGRGMLAYFWSSTIFNSSYAYSMDLTYSSPTVSILNQVSYLGLSVRCVWTDSTATYANRPTVATLDVPSVTQTTAIVEGEVTSDGGAPITSRGFCFSTIQNFSHSNTYIYDYSGGVGHFSCELSGLIPGNTYYVRAFATNSVSTKYGTTLSFTTQEIVEQSCSRAPSVVDYDENEYNTVWIGNQCWMKENLRVTHYKDGLPIELGNTVSVTDAYYYMPSDSSNVDVYGYLYNWKAAMGGVEASASNPEIIQGICPTGWHLPKLSEWVQLKENVSNMPYYLCGNASSNIAKSIASNVGWTNSNVSCAIGNNVQGNNATGFSAYPAGYFGDNGYYGLGTIAFFWSSSQQYSGVANYFSMFYDAPTVSSNYSVSKIGLSIRCVLDNSSEITVPIVSTRMPEVLSPTIAVLGGFVISNGGDPISARGVCWSTSPDPTLVDAHSVNGTAFGGFSFPITGLLPGTTYYVRAYATNGIGTSYGETITFTTSQ